MNTYLKYFPIPPQKGEVEPLSDEDLIESEGTALHKCKWCKKMVAHEDDDCWEKTGNEDVVKPHWAKRRCVELYFPFQL